MLDSQSTKHPDSSWWWWRSWLSLTTCKPTHTYSNILIPFT